MYCLFHTHPPLLTTVFVKYIISLVQNLFSIFRANFRFGKIDQFLSKFTNKNIKAKKYRNKTQARVKS